MQLLRTTLKQFQLKLSIQSKKESKEWDKALVLLFSRKGAKQLRNLVKMEDT